MYLGSCRIRRGYLVVLTLVDSSFVDVSGRANMRFCPKGFIVLHILFLWINITVEDVVSSGYQSGIQGKENNQQECDPKVSPCIHCTRNSLRQPATESEKYHCNSSSDPKMAVFVDVSGRKDIAKYTACILPCALHSFFGSSLSTAPHASSKSNGDPDPIATKAGNKITVQGPCQSCSCSRKIPVLSHLKRSLLVSVPRSGNTWMRKMLEDASGVPTMTVFGSEKINGRKNKQALKETFYNAKVSQEEALHFSGEKVVFDTASDLFVAPCGVINDCSRVHRRKNMTHTIVKTHSPFLPTSWARDAKCIGSDVGKGDTVVLVVRNPLDNYYAWIKYLKSQKPGAKIAFSDFLARWHMHFDYWISNAKENNVPTMIYRYEDVLTDECRATIVEAILRFSGLEDELGFPAHEAAFLAAANNSASKSLNQALVRYHLRSVEYGHTYTGADVAQALADPFVRLFNYDSLLRAWEDSLRNHAMGKGRFRELNIQDLAAGNLHTDSRTTDPNGTDPNDTQRRCYRMLH
eukprot:m.337177 g.337177  ORF g.337177 m.337177 type:complete len:521 (+) comp20546_c0_seq1:306-1868(+)